MLKMTKKPVFYDIGYIKSLDKSMQNIILIRAKLIIGQS